MTHLKHTTPFSLIIQACCISFLIIFFSIPFFDVALFVPDDYRYLQGSRLIEQGGIASLWRYAVIENRWDNNWWIDAPAYVRFFRLPVVLSFYLDYQLWGENIHGYLATNIFLHILTSVLVLLVSYKFINNKAFAFLAASMFALHGSHFENIYYISGRTDTLAGLSFLLCIYLFLSLKRIALTKRSKAAYPLCFLSFFFALLNKEYNILLFPLLVAYEAWGPEKDLSLKKVWKRLKEERFLYLGFLAMSVLYLLLRYFALGAASSGTKPYPYFFLPAHEGFWARSLAAWLQYVSGLSFDTMVHAFLVIPEKLYNRLNYIQIAIAIMWLPIILIFGYLIPKIRWLIAILLVTLVPLLPLYSSSRYLYIPSFAYLILISMLARYLWEKKGVVYKAIFISVIITHLLIPSLGYLSRGYGISAHLGKEIFNSKNIATKFLRADLPLPYQSLFVFEFPFDWLSAQFLDSIIAIEIGDNLPSARILTRSYAFKNAAQLRMLKLDDYTLRLWREGAPLIIDEVPVDFIQAKLAVGETIRRGPIKVTALAHHKALVSDAKFKFELPLCNYSFAQFVKENKSKSWKLQELAFKCNDVN